MFEVQGNGRKVEIAEQGRWQCHRSSAGQREGCFDRLSRLGESFGQQNAGSRARRLHGEGHRRRRRQGEEPYVEVLFVGSPSQGRAASSQGKGRSQRGRQDRALGWDQRCREDDEPGVQEGSQGATSGNKEEDKRRDNAEPSTKIWDNIRMAEPKSKGDEQDSKKCV